MGGDFETSLGGLELELRLLSTSVTEVMLGGRDLMLLELVLDALEGENVLADCTCTCTLCDGFFGHAVDAVEDLRVLLVQQLGSSALALVLRASESWVMSRLASAMPAVDIEVGASAQINRWLQRCMVGDCVKISTFPASANPRTMRRDFS